MQKYHKVPKDGYGYLIIYGARAVSYRLQNGTNQNLLNWQTVWKNKFVLQM